MSAKVERYHSKKFKEISSKTLIYILLVIISIIWLIPFVYLVFQSFAQSYSPSNFIPAAWTFDNYINLFTDISYPFGRWYLNTLLIAIITAILQTVFTLMTAYAFSRLRFRSRQAYMKFILVIGMFPSFLGMIVTYFLLQMIGLSASIFGLIVIYVAGSGMGYYVAKGFFDTIPKSLDEAAMIDGGKQELFNVAVGLQQMMTKGNDIKYFPQFCAGGVFVSIGIMALFFWLQKYYVEGVTGGAVKG